MRGGAPAVAHGGNNESLPPDRRHGVQTRFAITEDFLDTAGDAYVGKG